MKWTRHIYATLALGTLITCGVVIQPAGPALAASDIDKKPAKVLFGSVAKPANVKPRVYGKYTRGCIAGARELALDGPHHQAMRPSRNRNWGHPDTVDVVLRVAEAAVKKAGWPTLLVGDLTQPRGGPMLSGHASHQAGLDADIWLRPGLEKRFTPKEREEVSATSMLTSIKVAPKDLKVDRKKWGPGQIKVIKAAATDKRVARIFVNPAIKKALCKDVKKDRGWLAKVRPWYGHHYHFHVRLKCPKDSPACKGQAAVGSNPGCGKSLAYWFTDKPYAKRKKPVKFAPPLKIAALPRACRKVLTAE